jgi:hypothetical protein
MNPISTGGTNHSAPKSQLHRALLGDEAAQRQIYESTRRKLVSVSRRRAPELPRDLQEEIVGETWSLIYARGAIALLAANCSDDAYITQVHRNAVESVRAMYRPPLTRSRGGKWKASQPVEIESVSDKRDAYAEIDVAVDLRLKVSTMEAPVRAALLLLAENGLTISAAAQAVGVSRQLLSRRIHLFHLAA